MNKAFVIILAVIIAWIIGYVCYQGGKILWSYKDVSIVVKIVLSIIGTASGICIGILSWLGLLSLQKWIIIMNQKMKSIAWLIFGLLLLAGLLYLAINATNELNSTDYNPDAVVRAWRVIGACFGYIGAFVTMLYIVLRPLNSLLHGSKASEND